MVEAAVAAENEQMTAVEGRAGHDSDRSHRHPQGEGNAHPEVVGAIRDSL